MIGVIAANEVLQKLEETEPVDFIISTVPIQTQDYRVLVVRPFFNDGGYESDPESILECQQRRGIQPESGRKSLMSSWMP